LERRCRRVLKEAGCPGDTLLSVSLVDPRTIASLNRRYLGREGPTDVMAFPLGDDTPDGFLLGEVVVCPYVVGERREDYDVESGMELEYVVLHGLLHLLGYEDESEKGAEEMHRKQLELMRRAVRRR
jgi:probable rRNA maturation factor